MELTDQQGWSRLHGAIIGGVDSRELIADLLHERNILAEVQWFEHTDHQVSMVLAERHGRIATLTWDGETPQELTEGPLIEELVEELAGILDAEVRIGSFVADCLPAEGENNVEEPLEETSTLHAGDLFPSTVRMVEISRTPASSVPLFAAIQGAPLGSVELADGQRALFAHVNNGRKGWGFGELPTVTLVMDHRGVTILLVTDDHVEHMSAFDWTMHRQLVAGSRVDISAGHLPENLADLVTKRRDLLRIAEAVEGANGSLFALAALEAKDADDWQVAVAALGLPTSVINFLAGVHPLDDLEGVTVHPPISVSSAIGRSVDLAIEEASTVHPLWDTYESFVQERPWVLKSSIFAEAVAGAGLLTYAIASRGPASFWRKVAGWGGALMLVDAIAEFSVMSYVKKRQR